MTRPTFEINGRTYDTLTGAMLGRQQMGTSVATPKTAAMDGLIAPKRQSITAPQKPDTSKMLRPSRQPAHAAPRQPQPAKTLMRRAVKTPVTATIDGMKPVAAPSHIASPSGQLLPKVTPKLSSTSINPRRAQAARTAGRNQALQRFGDLAVPRQAWNPSANLSTSVSGAALPAAAQARPVTPQPQAPAASVNRQFNSFAGPTRRPVAAPSVAKPAARVPVAARPIADDNDNDLFAQALAHATSHEEDAPAGIKSPKHGRRRKQAFGIVASVAVFLALIGFVGFQNRDDIRLQMASAKAGFSASAPLYKPDGYTLASLKSAAGSVDSVYSQGNTQNFTISQKKSNWDSQTLLENFVATNNGDYQGFQSNGRTVYVYGKGNATWVNGGIWYQIKTDGGMQAEQLIKIAASM